MIIQSIVESYGRTVIVRAVTCEKCGRGHEWDSGKNRPPSMTRIKKELRMLGWSFGEKHVCTFCRQGRKKKKIKAHWECTNCGAAFNEDEIVFKQLVTTSPVKLECCPSCGFEGIEKKTTR